MTLMVMPVEVTELAVTVTGALGPVVAWALPDLVVVVPTLHGVVAALASLAATVSPHETMPTRVQVANFGFTTGPNPSTVACCYPAVL